MIKTYNYTSFAFGIPGLILQGASMLTQWPVGQEATATLLLWIGTGLLLIGLAFYAMAKGRHPAWCVMAFLSIVGLIVLGLLKDKSQQTTGQA